MRSTWNELNEAGDEDDNDDGDEETFLSSVFFFTSKTQLLKRIEREASISLDGLSP